MEERRQGMAEDDRTQSNDRDAIDVYYDMDIAQICQHFNKTRNTVDKAVAKLIKAYPDKGWKYKNPETRRITIKAEGVEKLSTYFRKEKHEVSAVETELRAENEKLIAVLQEKDKTIANLEVLYNERLKLELEKSRQTYLLESKSKDEEILKQKSHISELESENHMLNEQTQSLSSEMEKLEVERNDLKDQITRESDSAYQLRKEIEEYKRKEEEYNSKSFFYRLTHKFNK